MRLIHLLAAGVLAASLPAFAQTTGAFPERDKKLLIVVPFAAGGGVDAAARLLGEQLRKQLGMTVVVENKAGASGTIGGKFVQMSTSDGYTLLFSAATHVLAKQVLSKPPYDPQTDFAPVARTGTAPLMLVMSPSKPQKGLDEIVSAVKKEPGKWTAGIPASGAPSHLATLKLARQAQVNFTVVPYKGTQPALMDVAGGHTDLLLDSMIALQQMARTGKVKGVAVSSAKRSSLAPDLPTFRESGLSDFVFESWYGVWAPKDTPPDRIAALNVAINAATAELARSGQLANLGFEPVTETPGQFRSHIAAEVAEGAELLRSAGFKPE
jgi:tripartite-type tricarboxylate transporter receptor subunit TctC